MKNEQDREYIYSHYHPDWGRDWKRTLRNGFPVIDSSDIVPKRVVPFDKISKCGLGDACVVFHLADRRIDRVWLHPERYVKRLKEALCVATPDFSVLPGMERADVIHNISRSLRLGRYLQDQGIAVIITAIWSRPDTYDICFEALPANAVLLVSTVGSMRTVSSRRIFRDGLKTLCERKSPKGFILYGRMPSLDFDIPVIGHFERCSPIAVGAHQPEFDIMNGGR